jgi:hypothetical protein
MLSSPEPSGTPQPDSTTDGRSNSEHRPGLDEVLTLAESLDPKDQMRLIAQLLESLPPKHRAAIVEFGLQRERTPVDKIVTGVHLPRLGPTGPRLWERLFDPANTSELYSAPRRFDLATIFVVTAAYSLLFGLMTPLDFGPATKIVVGILVTMVAASQAVFQHRANPRGVSIVTGAVTLSALLIMLGLSVPSWRSEPLFVIVVFCGMIGGAIAGYLSGVLVGGVFLVADELRKYFVRRADKAHEKEAESNPESGQVSDSPWTN